jgi:hypothetical protein
MATNDLGDLIFKAIIWHMLPFRPGTMTIETSYLVSGFDVSVELYPKTKLHIPGWRIDSHSYTELADEIGRYFATLPTLPIGDNVVLSEN